MNEDRQYRKKLYRDWDEKFLDRITSICVARDCEHFGVDGPYWECNLITKINDEISHRIKDWERAKKRYDFKTKHCPPGEGRQWILESFMRNAHNIYYTPDDYFPTHKVPPACPHLFEHSIGSVMDAN